MGCCVSTGGGNRPVVAISQQNLSSQAIAASSVGRPSTQGSNVHPVPNHSRALASHPNRRIVRLVWTDDSNRWTRRTTIDKEREDFFDTQVTGQSQIWQTIHQVLEILWNSQAEDMDSLATAQAMLDGAEITCPHANMTKGLYDRTGVKYDLPKHIIADPDNLIDDTESVGEEGAKTDDEGVEAEGHEEEAQEAPISPPEEVDEATLRLREAKGKAVVDPNLMVELRAKRSDGVPGDLVIQVAKDEKVEVVNARLCVEADLPPSQTIRLHCRGKVLTDKETLESSGKWQVDWICNAQIIDKIIDNNEESSHGV